MLAQNDTRAIGARATERGAVMGATTRLMSWMMAVAAAAATCVFAGTGLATESAMPAMAKDLHISQRAMLEVKPEQPAKTGLAVNVTLDKPSGVYKKGETVVLKVQTTEDAYIWVLDTGTSGKVHQIFPNKFARNNFVKAGKPVTIPGEGAKYELAVNHPRGAELVTVLASRDNVPLTRDLLDAAASGGPFRALRGDATSVAKDLSITLKKQESPWSRDQVIFRIQ